jgi:Uri superfamily endonuclease
MVLCRCHAPPVVVPHSGAAASPFPSEAGVYILILELTAPKRIEVGRLGDFRFDAGWYAYVGSAWGSGGLRGRLAHHVKRTPWPHWHIDFLRRHAELRSIGSSAGPRELEHRWAATLLSQPAVSVPAPRFGASDCRCQAHLVYSLHRVDFEVLPGEKVDWLHIR